MRGLRADELQVTVAADDASELVRPLHGPQMPAVLVVIYPLPDTFSDADDGHSAGRAVYCSVTCCQHLAGVGMEISQP